MYEASLCMYEASLLEECRTQRFPYRDNNSGAPPAREARVRTELHS